MVHPCPRLLSSLAAAVLVTLATTATAQDRLEIDVSRAVGPATHRASGMVGLLSATQPADDIIRALKPRLFRLDPQWSRKYYQRVAGLGAAAQLVPSYPGFTGPAPGADFDAWLLSWEAALRQTVDESLERGETWQWDVWNEPNWPTYWKGTREQFFETWRRSHAVIRSRLPNAVIVGPSLAYYDVPWLQAFLLFARSANVLPDVLSWHELTGPASLAGRVANMRAFLAANGIAISRIQINGYTPARVQWRPGSLVQYFAEMERAGIDGACRACWNENLFVSNCVTNTLNGLLTTITRQPRSAYWAHHAYAEVVGQLVQVVPSPFFDGTAGVDAGTLRAVVGNHDPTARALGIRVSGLERLPGANQQQVHVRAWRIPNTGTNALAAPLPFFDDMVPVVSGAFELNVPNVAGWEAIQVEVAIGGS